MEITYLGHSCFLLNIENLSVLIDPFITPNPKVTVDPLTLPVDLMLITHGHGDHIADAASIAMHTGCNVLTNFEIAQWLEKQGVKNTRGVNHGGNTSVAFGNIKYVNAVHSSVLPDGTYGGNPGGFIIESKDQTIYYAGDTALTLDMKLLGDQFNIDFAFLPIGDTFTMGVEDAIRATKMVGTKKVIGMHYNTFPPIEIDTNLAVEKFKKEGLELTLLEAEETITI